MRRALVAFASFIAIKALAATPILLTLDDASRARRIPVVIHEPGATTCAAKCQVVVFGTGYMATLAEYSFLLEALAEAGFFVVGVQHDLEQDPPMPNTGDLTRDRTPFWDRGVENIKFVVATLKPRFPNQDWSGLVIAGHSQGGDIAARLAAIPSFPARALVTLDNRRVPLPPSMQQLPVLTIRSSDQSADPGVLPDLVTQSRPQTCIVRMPNTRHDDMNNSADASAKARMTHVVVQFLRQEQCVSEP